MEHISKIPLRKLPELVDSQPTRQSSDCADCRGTGWVRLDGGVRRCECARKRIADEQFRAIPPRFRGCRFENYVPIDGIQEAALGKILSNPGRGLFLHGGYGRGKTHLAVAQYRSLIDAGQTCSWRSMSELIHELQEAEIRNAHSAVLHRTRYAESFHLFIDDIDKFKPTDWKGEALFDLFDTIYRRELALTITSNWNLQALIENERVHPSIVRRIDETCLVVQV